MSYCYGNGIRGVGWGAGPGYWDNDPTSYYRWANGYVSSRFPALARPRGGSFKSFMRKAWRGIKKAHRFVRKHHLISSVTGLIPHPIFKGISSVASILGYGMRGGDLTSSGAWFGYRENPTLHRLC